MIATFVVLGIVLLAILWMMRRNDQVYRESVALIWEDLDAYKRLPGYDYMLLRFWIPVKRFVEEARACDSYRPYREDDVELHAEMENAGFRPLTMKERADIMGVSEAEFRASMAQQDGRGDQLTG